MSSDKSDRDVSGDRRSGVRQQWVDQHRGAAGRAAELAGAATTVLVHRQEDPITIAFCALGDDALEHQQLGCVLHVPTVTRATDKRRRTHRQPVSRLTAARCSSRKAARMALAISGSTILPKKGIATLRSPSTTDTTEPPARVPGGSCAFIVTG